MGLAGPLILEAPRNSHNPGDPLRNSLSWDLGDLVSGVYKGSKKCPWNWHVYNTNTTTTHGLFILYISDGGQQSSNWLVETFLNLAGASSRAILYREVICSVSTVDDFSVHLDLGNVVCSPVLEIFQSRVISEEVEGRG